MTTKQIVVISGPAGCGKSVAAKALEDCGFFVVDNFPPQLFTKMIDLADHVGSTVSKVGFVIDAREPSFLAKFPENWHKLIGPQRSCSLIYLDASDETIISRFKETRRRHPLDVGDGVKKSIHIEREMLIPLAHLATHRLNTDGYSVHRLAREIRKRFTQEDSSMLVTILSFGFKYGIPPELDLCFDVRFLDNPHFIDGLRAGTGLDEAVANHVLKSPEAIPFTRRMHSLLKYLLPLYRQEGKSYLTIAIGCTGGRHRSVTIAEKVAGMLSSLKYIHVVREHRDITKANSV